MEEHVMRLADRKIRLVVNRLNKVLDEERIYGQEFNKEIIKALILDNLTKKKTCELIDELNNTPISDWND